MGRSDILLLELNFYYADLPERLAFRRLLRALCQQGACFAGRGLVQRGPGFRDLPFASPFDAHNELLHFDFRQLDRILADPDQRLVQVEMVNAVGLGLPGDEEVEIVRYTTISDAAARSDNHPIAIVTDGSLLQPRPDMPALDRIQARSTAARVLAVFHNLVRTTRPAYAAITSEYFMECPADLHADPGSLAFGTFYIGEPFVGPDNLAHIRRLYAGAHIEPLAQGLFITTSELFSPQGQGSGWDTTTFYTRSRRVARIIASCYRPLHRP